MFLQFWEPPQEGDRSKPRFYHGGDLQGVIDKLPYLQDLGITTIWLNPWYDNNDGLNWVETYDGQPMADYHGYGAVDFYAVDEHLGDLDTLVALVEAAHARGMKIVQDQVANHSGPYHPWVEDSLREVMDKLTGARDKRLADVVSKARSGYDNPEYVARSEDEVTLRKGFAALGASDKAERRDAFYRWNFEDLMGKAMQQVGLTG